MRSLHLEPSRPFAALRVGDVVKVHTRDGRQDQFRVARISATEIVGTKGQTYQASEVARLQRRAFSNAKTTALGAGIAVAILFAYYLAYAIALDGIMGP